MLLRLALASARAQMRMSRRNVEDVMPLLTAPLLTLVSMAVLTAAGRTDLAGYSLVAAVLMSVERMSTMVASETLVRDRRGQMFELAVASPSPYFVTLTTRIALLAGLGIVGLLEGWLIVWLVFGVAVPVHHPGVLVATLGATIFAAAATSTIFASIFCFGRTPRTYQNALSGPLYLLGGVLVPVSFLPDWIQPVSQVIFLKWSADLLRASLQPETPGNILGGLAAILLLGALATWIGIVLFGRLVDHHRREGTLGFA